jgi:hypothetical protein
MVWGNAVFAGVLQRVTAIWGERFHWRRFWRSDGIPGHRRTGLDVFADVRSRRLAAGLVIGERLNHLVSVLLVGRL